MELTDLVDHVSSVRERGIKFYAEGARVGFKAYSEVSRDVRELEERLRGWEIGAGTRVGIMASNCYEWIVLDLALMRLGAISVCLPIIEFEQIPLAELGEKYDLNLLLLGSGTRADDHLPEWAARFRAGLWERPKGFRSKPPAVALPNDDVFSLVFSSGTSGKIKCLPISQRGTAAWIDAYGEHFTFRPDDRILIVLPLSVYQQRVMVYTAMRYQFNVLLADPSQFFRALKELKPTIILGPPLFYETLENRFYALPERQQRLLKLAGALLSKIPMPQLRHWAAYRVFKPFYDAFGGEARLMLSGAAPSRISTLDLYKMLDLPLYQVYGLTEAGVISWNLPGKNRIGSVGKPVFPNSVVIAEDGEILVRHVHPQSYPYLYLEEDEVKKTFTDCYRACPLGLIPQISIHLFDGDASTFPVKSIEEAVRFSWSAVGASLRLLGAPSPKLHSAIHPKILTKPPN